MESEIFVKIGMYLASFIIPLCAAFIAAWGIMRFHNMVKRVIGRAAAVRSGVSKGAVLVFPTAIGTQDGRVRDMTSEEIILELETFGKEIGIVRHVSFIGFESQTVDIRVPKKKNEDDT